MPVHAASPTYAGSGWETRAPVSPAHVVSTVCTSLSFSDGLDKLQVEVQCRGGCDAYAGPRLLHQPGELAGAAAC